eukprot:TRINITY_DN36237_c0_g1_i2.p1 TRINITY_DN36237_c0_g1~~TRINITY_DN36237_c0_g1_i2.p1  ORF type:complete len:128 (-),score=10.79 TRINITY_DN36237_c0_g1_i2:166-549(-)
MIKIQFQTIKEIQKYGKEINCGDQQYPRRYKYWGKIKTLQSKFGKITLFLFTINFLQVFSYIIYPGFTQPTINLEIEQTIYLQIVINLFCLIFFIINIVGFVVIKASAAFLAFFAPDALIFVKKKLA